MHSFRRNLWSRYFLIGSVLAFLIVSIVAGLIVIQRSKNSPSKLSLVQGLNQCSKNADGTIASVLCARQLISAQLKTRSTAELMAEIATSTLPRQYEGCHGIAHIIGEETYNKYKDVEEALDACTNTCYGGCLHGVAAGAVKADFGAADPGVDIAHMDLHQLENVGSKYCGNISLCHGIGHILYYLLNNFERASEACDAVAVHLARMNCISGVFMQGVGGLHDSLVMDDTALPIATQPSKDYAYPCDTVSKEFKRGCYLYLPRYQDISFQAYGIDEQALRLKIATRICEAESQPARSYCFEGIGQYTNFYVTKGNESYLSRVSALCLGFSSESDQKSCILGYVHILRGYDDFKHALNFCPMLPSDKLQSFCYFANFSVGKQPAIPTSETECAQSNDPETCGAAFEAYKNALPSLPDYRYGLFGESS